MYSRSFQRLLFLFSLATLTVGLGELPAKAESSISATALGTEPIERSNLIPLEPAQFTTVDLPLSTPIDETTFASESAPVFEQTSSAEPQILAQSPDSQSPDSQSPDQRLDRSQQGTLQSQSSPPEPIAPRPATPYQTNPDTNPDATSPRPTSPNTTPPNTAPPSSTPSQTLPVQTIPAQTVPQQNLPQTEPLPPRPASPDETNPYQTEPGSTAPETTPGQIVPDTTRPETPPAEQPSGEQPSGEQPSEEQPSEEQPSESGRDRTPPGTFTPDTSDVSPGRATRSGSSYIGVGGNIGLGDGDTALGEGSFSVFSKVGLTSNISARPALLVSDDPTILLPLTLDFSPLVTGATEDLSAEIGRRVSPYLGAGVAISTGDDSAVDFLATAGVDVPLTRDFTATASVNATLFDNPAVGLLLGVGFNF